MDEKRISATKHNWNSIQKAFRTARDQLQTELKLDEKKLAYMTCTSNKTLEHLEIILNKGQQIKSLVEICKKFETEEEKVIRYQILFEEKIYNAEEKESETSVKLSAPETDNVMKLFRPVTSKQPRAKSTCMLRKSVVGDFKTEKPVNRVMLEPKRNSIELQATENDSQRKTNFIERKYKSVFDLEGLWTVHSRIKVKLLELKIEKRNLLRENEQLKTLLKNVLEQEVLKRSAPCSRITSGVVSHRIRGKSAPAKCFL